MTRRSRPPRRAAGRQAERDAIAARRPPDAPQRRQEPPRPPPATVTPDRAASAEAALVEAGDEIARLEAANAALTALLAQQPGLRKRPKPTPG